MTMKITSIQTSNFLGARAVDLQLTKPVALIAGKNGAGKSSIQEAVRMALTGEPVRVGLKKDYPALLSEGAEAGFADVLTDQSQYSIIIPGGKGVHCEHAALPYVLDAQRFARLSENERRQFLFGLMNVKLDGPAIKQRMVDIGCDPVKIEQIAPILRAGFEAASTEAANKARECKASWKTATGGETWGKDKAAKWQPPALEFDADTAEKLLANARTGIAADDADIGKLQQEIGAARAEIQRRQGAETRRMELHEKAGKIQRIQDKLNLDTAELSAWEQKVSDCRAAAGVEQPDPKEPGQYLLRGLASVTGAFLRLSAECDEVEWPSELINRAAAHLAEYKKLHGDPVGNDAGPDQEAVTKLPEYEKALELMQRAVANGSRDLESAKEAKAEYDRIVEEQGSALPDVEEMEKTLRELTARREVFRSDEKKYSDMARQAAGRADLVAKVAQLHADVMAWAEISEALAPDGIPAALLAEALGPINDRLLVSAANAEWSSVTITRDMAIYSGFGEGEQNQRPYTMLSESEKWRADAMIAEAVAHISGLKLLVLDRFDVLDSKGREDLLYWLDGMAADGDIDTALIFGTLKALPALNFDNIGTFWIENGAAGQIKEAA